MLRPVHDEVLRKIPMEGTFHKTRPLDRLQVCFSYDLKSATDPFPVMFQRFVLQALFGTEKRFVAKAHIPSV